MTLVSVSVELIDYLISCDGKAIIQFWNESTINLLPRNCVIFHGHRIPLYHLRAPSLTSDVKTILIPYSLHTMSSFRFSAVRELEYLVFEFGSGLQSIFDLNFTHSRLVSLFFPPSVRFIGPCTFDGCSSISSVHFGDQSSLRHFSFRLFSGLRHIRAITIPSSVKCITNGAFRKCVFLRVVTFAALSQCCYIYSSAFKKCYFLEPISLPPSVEFIECDSFGRFPFLVNGHNFLIRDDCLLRTNGRELIRYLGDSETFCVGRAITVLATRSFFDHSSLRTLNFELPSRLTHFLDHTFHGCYGLCFVEIPKSVCFTHTALS
jgi:hypothetical protein